MNQPIVSCVMLTFRGRERFAERAQRCWLGQTHRSILVRHNTTNHSGTVGDLRNAANARAAGDLIAHWDDDDVSLPGRLAHQVAFLRETGADLVGFRDLLFYDSLNGDVWYYRHPSPSFCVGTSMLYRRELWEASPFAASSKGEDTAFWYHAKAKGFRVAACSSIVDGEPLLIAELHAGNTATRKQLEKGLSIQPDWLRCFQPAEARLADRVRELMRGA